MEAGRDERDRSWLYRASGGKLAGALDSSLNAQRKNFPKEPEEARIKEGSLFHKCSAETPELHVRQGKVDSRSCCPELGGESGCKLADSEPASACKAGPGPEINGPAAPAAPAGVPPLLVRLACAARRLS